MNCGRLATLLAVGMCGVWGFALAQTRIDPVTPFEPPPRHARPPHPPEASPGGSYNELPGALPSPQPNPQPVQQQQLFVMCVLADGKWTILHVVMDDPDFHRWQPLIGTECHAYGLQQFPGVIAIGTPSARPPFLFYPPKPDEKGDDKLMDKK